MQRIKRQSTIKKLKNLNNIHLNIVNLINCNLPEPESTGRMGRRQSFAEPPEPSWRPEEPWEAHLNPSPSSSTGEKAKKTPGSFLRMENGFEQEKTLAYPEAFITFMRD